MKHWLLIMCDDIVFMKYIFCLLGWDVIMMLPVSSFKGQPVGRVTTTLPWLTLSNDPAPQWLWLARWSAAAYQAMPPLVLCHPTVWIPQHTHLIQVTNMWCACTWCTKLINQLIAAVTASARLSIRQHFPQSTAGFASDFLFILMNMSLAGWDSPV